MVEEPEGRNHGNSLDYLIMVPAAAQFSEILIGGRIRHLDHALRDFQLYTFVSQKQRAGLLFPYRLDLFHHLLQVREPRLSSVVCSDPNLSRQSLYDFLNKCTDSDTLICPAHFTGMEIGHMGSEGDGWRLDFMPA